MSLRHAARALVDRAAAFTGMLATRERAMRKGLTVLTYHRVLPDDRCVGYRLPSLVMPLSAFREQVRFLSSRCRVVTAAQGVEHLATTLGQGRAPVSLTFDDGYRDNFVVAAPVLEEFHVRGTFYVCTGLLGTQERPWFDTAALLWQTRGAETVAADAQRILGRRIGASASPSINEWMSALKALAPPDRRRVLTGVPRDGLEPPDELDRLMTPGEVKDLDRRGHEIGSHSVTHPLLPQLSAMELEEELTRSRQDLTTILGKETAGFCYPNGDCDDRVAAATRRAGYLYACTTVAGRNAAGQDRFRLTRIDMNPRRVMRDRRHDEMAFRAEISLLHGALR